MHHSSAFEPGDVGPTVGRIFQVGTRTEQPSTAALSRFCSTFLYRVRVPKLSFGTFVFGPDAQNRPKTPEIGPKFDTPLESAYISRTFAPDCVAADDQICILNSCRKTAHSDTSFGLASFIKVSSS